MNIVRIICAAGLVLMASFGFSEEKQPPQAGQLVQYGEMHEAIGQGKDEGRIRLGELTKRNHFYAVAALEGLEGEVTIRDGKITATIVEPNSRLASAAGDLKDKKATMLVGAYVPAWKEIQVAKDIAPDDFDAYIAAMAKKAGVSTDEPFMFTVEGKLTKVRLHVIHGACPIQARLKDTELPKDQRPFETELVEVKGTIVAVFADDAVGKITHPATKTHGHILYRDPSTGKMVTAHLEAVGISEGATLKMPKT